MMFSGHGGRRPQVTRGRLIVGLGQFLLHQLVSSGEFGLLARSAAERLSAIFWACSSNALVMGGHTNFIGTTPAVMKKTMIRKNRSR